MKRANQTGLWQLAAGFLPTTHTLNRRLAVSRAYLALRRKNSTAEGELAFCHPVAIKGQHIYNLNPVKADTAVPGTCCPVADSGRTRE